MKMQWTLYSLACWTNIWTFFSDTLHEKIKVLKMCLISIKQKKNYLHNFKNRKIKNMSTLIYPKKIIICRYCYCYVDLFYFILSLY